MPMYNLKEYSNNYLTTSVPNGNIVDFNAANATINLFRIKNK